MITIACWKWRRNSQGFQLPGVCNYGPGHVHMLRDMLARHVTAPYRFVCITDDPSGLDVETIPLWGLYPAGGCYHRLKLFSPWSEKILGPRWCWIDMDCVITGNIDHILSMHAPIVLNRYTSPERTHQHYNGSFVMMDAGCRAHVWDTFDPDESPRAVAASNEARRTVGTDQAWMSMALRAGEQTIGPEVGVHEARLVGSNLPSDARLVFFSGPRDPSQFSYGWVNEHYR